MPPRKEGPHLRPKEKKLAVQTERGERNLAKGVWIVLGHTVAEQLITWMQANGQTDLNEALRILLTVGMSSMPELGLINMARKRAYDHFRKEMVTDTIEFLNMKLKKLMDEAQLLSYLQSTAPAEVNPHAQTTEGNTDGNQGR